MSSLHHSVHLEPPFLLYRAPHQWDLYKIQFLALCHEGAVGKACTVAWLLSVVGEEGRGVSISKQWPPRPKQIPTSCTQSCQEASVWLDWCHQPCFSFCSGTDSDQSSLGLDHWPQPRRPSMPTGTLSRSLPLSPAYLCIPLCSLSSTRPWFLGRFDLLALPASFPFFSYWWPMTSPLAGLKEQLPSHLSSPSPGHPPRKWQLQTDGEPYAIYCRVH